LEIKDEDIGHGGWLISRIPAVKLADLTSLARSCYFKRLGSRDH
jgi:hypothetical protein